MDFTTFVDLLGPLCGGFAVHYVKSVLNVVSSMSRKSPIECVLSRLSAILTILIILFSSIHIITESYRIAAYLPIYHIDGAFQHASALFRMESGHFPGRDFYPYVGIIPNMLNYPLFKVFGSNLMSAVLSSYAVTYFCWLTVIFLGLVCNLRLGVHSAIILSVFLYFAFKSIDLPSYYVKFSFYQGPGTSLRPLRSFAPYFVAICLMAVLKINNRSTKLLLCAFVIGLALVWSNDYSFAVFFVFFLLTVFLGRMNSKDIVFLFLFSLLSGFLFLSIFTAFHPLEMLKYNMVDVRKSQFWYYGPYGPRLQSFVDVMRVSQFATLALLFWFQYFVNSIRVRDTSRVLWSGVGASLFLGGSISSYFGVPLDRYYDPFLVWFALTLLIVCLNPISSLLSLLFKSLPLKICLFAVVLFLNQQQIEALYRERERADRVMVFVSELGGYIEPAFKDYIDFIKENGDKKWVEEYFGIWGSTIRMNPDTKVDSMIHALGKEQKESVLKALREAEFVTTTHWTDMYAKWNFRQNFWFYDQLIGNFVPYYLSPTTLVWKRTDRYDAWIERGECDVVKEENNRYSLLFDNEDSHAIYRVNLEYRFESRRGILVVSDEGIQSSPSIDYVSLNPFENYSSFPVFGGSRAEVRIFGDGSLSIGGCTYSELKRPLYPFRSDLIDVTDDVWLRGVSRAQPALHLPNLRNYRVGEAIVLPDGDVRRIMSVTEKGSFLEVFLEGDPLDIDVVFSSSVITGDFYLTDQNWQRGFSYGAAAFFVPNTPYYRELYSVGKRIDFLRAGIREITAQKEEGMYLHVFFSGGPIWSVLPPSDFRVMDD